MRTLALLVLLSWCGAPPAAELETTSAEVHLVDAGAEVPTARCYCCWPGSNRCRFTRAASSPADACESDPEQRCVLPDAGVPSGSP